MFATRVRTTSSPAVLPGIAVSGLLRALAPYALLAAIGVELALLTAFLPETVDRLVNGPSADFHNLYQPARDRELAGLYSPFLILLFQPLALLPEMAAYRLFFVVNVAALVGVSLLMQRGVRLIEARVAVALAPLALPQVHWALRLGHLTPLLAVALLGGLILLQTRPRWGAVVLAFVSLKPQYAIAPLVYLCWKRQFRLVAVMAGLSAALAAAGFALAGPDSVPRFFARYVDWGPNSTDNLLPVQQSWMISWTGFQLSLWREANPLITFDLIALSLAIAMFTWSRAGRPAGAAVVALMLVPLTPYAQFYDGALVLVAIALILRTGLATWTRVSLSAGLYLAAIVTQANIPFPAKDVLGPAQSNGVYWLTPAFVLAAAAIALLSRREPETEAQTW
jgi:hypothetical protein